MPTIPNDYATTFGVMAGYLPHNLDAIGEWQADILAEARAEHPELAAANADALDATRLTPAVGQLISLLASEPALYAQVEAMIAEQASVKPDGKPAITSVLDLMMALAYISRRAPEFNEDPAKRNFFPMSALFVYMMYTPTGSQVFSNAVFTDVLRRVLQEWCSFLDSTDSQYVLNRGPQGWLSPAASELMDLPAFVIPDPDAPHGGFASFNAYFHRQIKLDQRPLAGVGDPHIVVSANDGTVYRIARGVKRLDSFWIKTQPYSLADMLAGIDQPGLSVDQFVGGDVFQAFLSGANYHRWRAPVSGTIVAQMTVDGLMFSELRSEGFDDSAGTLSQGYQASVNTRGLTFIRADYEPLGTVCVMPIGITEISSIRHERAVGDHVEKGDELGYFSYGGSTLCLIFQPGAVASFSVPAPPPGQTGVQIQVRSEIARAS